VDFVPFGGEGAGSGLVRTTAAKEKEVRNIVSLLAYFIEPPH